MSARDGEFELITLRNGHRAVRHLGHGEVMHPAVGPWGEANRLYVEQTRLAERLRTEGPPLRILDVGLGAAANAVAALTCARALGHERKRALWIESHELDLAPLRLARADAEGFPFLQPWADAIDALMATGRWEAAGRGGEVGLHWILSQGDLRQTIPAHHEHCAIVFFDPFSPNHDPHLWSPEVLATVRARCTDDALVVTYSAATPTRVSFLLGGFFLGAGWAIGTKKETTIASPSKAALEQPLGPEFLGRWSRSPAKLPHGNALPEDEVRARLEAHPQFAATASPAPAANP